MWNDTDILSVKTKMINQDRMILGDFSVNFEPISLKFCKDHFLSNLKEIGLEMMDKSAKIMRSWLIIFNLTAGIVNSG